MDIDPKSLEVKNNGEENQYEIHINGSIAKIEYRLRNDRITFVHTEVPDELEGQGIASKMARFVLDEAKSKGYSVRPMCPFIKGYIERHPEYQSLVRRKSGE